MRQNHDHRQADWREGMKKEDSFRKGFEAGKEEILRHLMESIGLDDYIEQKIKEHIESYHSALKPWEE